ncbi:MAG: hypothetical protein ACR2GK_12605 [Gemmatimonadaceae bacterium]
MRRDDVADPVLRATRLAIVRPIHATTMSGTVAIAIMMSSNGMRLWLPRYRALSYTAIAGNTAAIANPVSTTDVRV